MKHMNKNLKEKQNRQNEFDGNQQNNVSWADRNLCCLQPEYWSNISEVGRFPANNVDLGTARYLGQKWLN